MYIFSTCKKNKLYNLIKIKSKTGKKVHLEINISEFCISLYCVLNLFVIDMLINQEQGIYSCIYKLLTTIGTVIYNGLIEYLLILPNDS